VNKSSDDDMPYLQTKFGGSIITIPWKPYLT